MESILYSNFPDNGVTTYNMVIAESMNHDGAKCAEGVSADYGYTGYPLKYLKHICKSIGFSSVGLVWQGTLKTVTYPGGSLAFV